MDRKHIEQRLRDFFAEDSRGALVVYLFGSVARQTSGARSDVDIGVLLEQDPPRTLAGLRLDLEDDLRGLLGLEVQLVVLNRASVDLIHRVLRDGRLILDRDPSRRIAFEVKARREYFDLLPVLRQYRRQEALS